MRYYYSFSVFVLILAFLWLCSERILRGFCATAGTIFPPPQGGDRGGSSSGSRTWLFQSLFSRSKEGRRPMLDPWPSHGRTSPFTKGNVDAESYYVTDSCGRLVCHRQPEGCLFSYSGRSVTREVRLLGNGLPVQGSYLWPGLDTKDIHKVHGCCSGPIEAPGHPYTELPGRLVHFSPLQGISELPKGCFSFTTFCFLASEWTPKRMF